jgi:hypothetical protein
MRLNEFTDTANYTPTADEAERFFQQLLRIWPRHPADDLVPSTLRNNEQPEIKRTKLFDAL